MDEGIHIAKGPGERDPECPNYSHCLDVADGAGWRQANCEKCPRFQRKKRLGAAPKSSSSGRVFHGDEQGRRVMDEKDVEPVEVPMCKRCGENPAHISKDGRTFLCWECRSKAIKRGKRKVTPHDVLKVDKAIKEKEKEGKMETKETSTGIGFSLEKLAEILSEYEEEMGLLKPAAERAVRTPEHQVAHYVIQGLRVFKIKQDAEKASGLSQP